MKTWKSDFRELGKRLRSFREARNLTPVQTAAALEVPLSTYREWENGRAIRGLPYVKIAEVLQINLMELMTGQKPEKMKVIESLNRIEKMLMEHRRLLSFF